MQGVAGADRDDVAPHLPAQQGQIPQQVEHLVPRRLVGEARRIAEPRVPDHQGILQRRAEGHAPDRKSTRLNSSHTVISYAVFCLKKKKKKKKKKKNNTYIQ